MNKIIWAVDISHDPSESQNMVKELTVWAKKLNAIVQPVSVVSTSMFNIPLSAEYPWNKNFKQNALALFQTYLKKIRATEFKAPHIIFSSSLSSRKAAQELIQYALKEKASFIFAHTRSRSHWSPLGLGGFADALGATSPIPVLLLNLKSRPTPQINSILLPTDLSPASRHTLRQLALIAQAFQAKIVLYNQVEEIPTYLSASDNFEFSRMAELETNTIEKARTQKIHAWANQLKRQGIDSLGKVQRQKSYIGKDILVMAKQNKVQLIALTSDNRIFSQSSLSSSIKDVILRASSPVLIFNRMKSVRKLSEKSSVDHAPDFKKITNSPEALHT